MKEEIRREETRNIESYITRLEDLLSKQPTRQRKIVNSTNNNIAGPNTGHLPNFSTSNIIDTQLFKKDSGN
jgi:hypothetical protein